MATTDIAIACQGGGSHAAYTGGVLPVLLAEFDNLAAAQAGPATAYREPGTPPGINVPVLVAISGTSGGAISALLGWYGFLAGACGCAAGLDLAQADGACRADIGRAALVVDGATLYSVAGTTAVAPRALVRWRSVDAEVDGRPVRIEGRSELADDLESEGAWRVKDVRITAVTPQKETAPPAAAARRPARSGRGAGARPQ